MTLAEKLKELRKSSGLTQEELAAGIFVSRPMIAKYETGKAYPTNEILQKIADYFEVSIDELVQKEALIDEHAKTLDSKLSNDHKIATLVAVIGILLVSVIAILSVIEIDKVETVVDFVQLQYDEEWARWNLIYFEESTPDIWHRRQHLYVSEFNSWDKNTVQFTIEGEDWFLQYNKYGISEDYRELKNATLYYRVTVRKNLLGIIQGKGYYLEKVDFHLK